MSKKNIDLFHAAYGRDDARTCGECARLLALAQGRTVAYIPLPCSVEAHMPGARA